MLRTTHFVILFAVFLFAYAAPAAKESPTTAKEVELKKVESKSDLATDNTVSWAYTYRYSPSWHTFVPGFAGKTLEHGFLKTEVSLLPHSIYYPPAARILLVH